MYPSGWVTERDPNVAADILSQVFQLLALVQMAIRRALPRPLNNPAASIGAARIFLASQEEALSVTQRGGPPRSLRRIIIRPKAGRAARCARRIWRHQGQEIARYVEPYRSETSRKDRGC